MVSNFPNVMSTSMFKADASLSLCYIYTHSLSHTYPCKYGRLHIDLCYLSGVATDSVTSELEKKVQDYELKIEELIDQLETWEESVSTLKEEMNKLQQERYLEFFCIYGPY